MRCWPAWLLVPGLLLPLPALAAEVVVNEWNGVRDDSWLNGGDALMDAEGGFAQDVTLGRVLGNGGNWLELVVVADHLDLRGWGVSVCDLALCPAEVRFSSDLLWSDLRAGTIITVSTGAPVPEMLEDPSYDPTLGDWWIHVVAGAGGTGTYVSASDFEVSNDATTLTVLDDLDRVVFGPTGETIVGEGLNSREVLKLEAPPSALTTPDDAAYNDGVSSSFGAPNVWSGGVGLQDLDILRLGLPFPDRDGDGIADDGDQSGVAGDAPCVGGDTTACDDNCPVMKNPNQSDVGGHLSASPDGTGDVCQCGDPDDDGDADADDVDLLRDFLVGLVAELPAEEKCGVYGDGRCNAAQVAALIRANSGRPPGISPACTAGAIPSDPTELLFREDRVLDVVIAMSQADWDAVRLAQRSVRDALGPGCFDGPPVSPFVFHPASVSIDGSPPITGAGVRKKGFFGSNDFVKPSLKIDFTEFGGVPFSGMDRLTLNNAKQDPALIKQCLGYRLFAEVGLPAPRCNFARVSIDVGGAPALDLGLYVNVESIKEPFLERHFASASGNLYEGAISDFRPVWVNTFEKKTNETDPDRSDLDAVVAALQVADPQLEAALDAVIDLDRFYTFWAMEALIAHWDSYHSNRNNFWMYFEPGGKLVFIPWGIDAIMAGGNPLQGGGPVHAVATARGQLARRLYLNGPTRDLYLARLDELLNGVWDESALLDRVQRMEDLLTPFDPTLGPFIDQVRTFINDRRGQIQSELAAGPPAWTEPEQEATCFQEVGDVVGEFDTTWESLDSLTGPGTLTITSAVIPQPTGFTISQAGMEQSPGGSFDGVMRVVVIGGTITALNWNVNPALIGEATYSYGGMLVFLADVGAEISLTAVVLDGVLEFDPETGPVDAVLSPGDRIKGRFTGKLAQGSIVGDL